MHEEADIAAWLEIHNDAFGSAWGLEDYEREILHHPTVTVWHTYLIMDGSRALGSACAGVYRRNPEVGAGHFLALRRSAHGRGLGRHIVLYRYHRLREAGIRLCESETTLRNRESIGIHFACGFRPKTRLDAWNSPDPGDALQRWITRQRLERLYRRWSRQRSGSRASRAFRG
jgi:GNAT superfamily N-acetyltransferase